MYLSSQPSELISEVCEVVLVESHNLLFGSIIKINIAIMLECVGMFQFSLDLELLHQICKISRQLLHLEHALTIIPTLAQNFTAIHVLRLRQQVAIVRRHPVFPLLGNGVQIFNESSLVAITKPEGTFAYH